MTQTSLLMNSQLSVVLVLVSLNLASAQNGPTNSKNKQGSHLKKVFSKHVVKSGFGLVKNALSFKEKNSLLEF